MAFSFDYGRAIASLGWDSDPISLGSILFTIVAERYESTHGESALHEFEQGGARYLFDLASEIDPLRADRTVAAWTVTPVMVGARDVVYQRGFPMPGTQRGAAVDRGHLIPHLSGGEFGPNIFRQDRRLNRGWSDAGKTYRALEREVASDPGAFYFGHLIYGDATDYPVAIEIGILRAGSLHVEWFDNRPGA